MNTINDRRTSKNFYFSAQGGFPKQKFRSNLLAKKTAFAIDHTNNIYHSVFCSCRKVVTDNTAWIPKIYCPLVSHVNCRLHKGFFYK